MYLSLYRRYRPQKFSEVVGQTAAIGVITRAIETGTIGHAYLFSGPRGCGKTTVARLFAKAVNCPDRNGAEPCNKCETCRAIVDGDCLDVIEIDGASNNGVDEIRELKERVALASFSCPYKVYIVDEVHMLSTGAFNALLKTLEEPPERVIFILATTAPHKVPVTIRSRCQHIPFHGMTAVQIVSRLEQVAAAEGIQVQNEALWEIARNSEGGMRDALSLMEQAIAYGTGNVNRETIDKLLGGGSSLAIRQWVSLCHASPEKALPQLETLFCSGAVAERFISVLFTCVRNLWLQAQWGSSATNSLMLSDEEKKWLRDEESSYKAKHLERLMSQLASLLPQVRRGISNDVLSGLLVSWMLTPEPVTEITPVVKNEVSASVQVTKPLDAQTDRAKQTKSAIENAVNSPSQATAELQKAPQVPPQVKDLAPSSGALKQNLIGRLSAYPNIIVPLLLADIVHYEENGSVALSLDVEDSLAFEALKDERALRSVATILRECGVTVSLLTLFCGDRSERLSSEVNDDRSSQWSLPVSEEAKKTPPIQMSGDGDAASQSPVRNTPPVTAPAEVKKAFSGRNENQFLSDFLRGLADASLLYYRPNEDSIESAQTEED